ncbi:hypothetical protein AHAS_Ahas16G0172300 [Arachis hypogaea]
MPPDTYDPDTLRQYARSYIMLMIGGYLLTNKSNNTVHLRWLPLLDDFERCRRFSWDSVVLAWTYHSLCHAAHCQTTNIMGCTPLLVSWIYQRFPRWCPPERAVYMLPMTARDYRPTREYWDWWRMTCRVTHLSGPDVLDDPRLVELPEDVQPTTSKPRDIFDLP